MKKKLTKTIGLIVFVMFMNIFISNVNAETGDVALTCIYDHPNQTVILNISNSANISRSDSCSFNGEIYNWASAKYENFVGRDYYVKNYECPPYAVYNASLINAFSTVIMAESESNANNIANDVIGGKTMKLKEQIIGDSASQDIKESTSSNQNIKNLKLPKNCECSSNSNGKEVSLSFNVNKNFSDPGFINVGIGSYTANLQIDNWKSNVAGFKYVDYLFETDSCPKYALVSKGSVFYSLHLSDEAHLNDLKRKVGQNEQYVLSCSDKKNSSTSNSNTTSNSNSTSNKKSNSNSNTEDPSVNSNVIRTLNYDVSSYSCGNGYMTGIPARIPKFGKLITTFLQILIPIILIIYGSIDLVKAVYAQKEDDIKKAQQTFIKRLFSAIIVFFVFAIVRLVVSVVSKNNSQIMDCVDCILNFSDNCKEEA